MSNQGDIAPSLPSVATVDTLDLQHLIDAWVAEKTMPVWRALIAHIDAHVTAQVAAALSAQAAAPLVASEGSKLEHECEFLQDWLQTAAEPCGRECCGHGVGGECCGDAEPVFMTYPEFLEAMQARLKEVTALLSSQPSPAPVAMTDEQIDSIRALHFNYGVVSGALAAQYWGNAEDVRSFARAILAAQQEAV